MLPKGFARYCRPDNREALEADINGVSKVIDAAAGRRETVGTNSRLTDQLWIPLGRRTRQLRAQLVTALQEFTAHCERHEAPRIPGQRWRTLPDGAHEKVGPPIPRLPSTSDKARDLLRSLTASPVDGGDTFWFDPPTHRKKARGPRTKEWLEPYRRELRALGLKTDEVRELLQFVGLAR
jgi:hypothetical protein